MTDEIPQAGDTPASDANATPEIIEGSEPESSPGADTEGENAKKPDGFTKRIDELTRQWRETERDRDAAKFEAERHRREVEQLRREVEQSRQRPQASEEGEAKTLADFGFDEVSYGRYLQEQADARATKTHEQRERDRQIQERSERNWSEFQKRADTYAKESPGYTEAFKRLEGFFPSHVADGLVESEEGPALVEFLGNNIAEASALRKADPYQAGRLIATYEAKIASEREKAKAKAPSAPPPPAPKVDGSEGSGASAKPDSPDSDELSDAEWARRRNAQVRARAQRK